MKRRCKTILSAVLAAVLIPASIGFADEGSLVDMIKDLQKQMSGMQNTINQQNQKIRELESTPKGTAVAVNSASAGAPMSDQEFNDRLSGALGGADKWLKDLKFSGDLRLRYEAATYTSGNPKETDPRNRFRFRLRYGFEKKFSDQMKIGFFMNSGGINDQGTANDPTSTNQTLTGNFNWKSLFIERAWATYTPTWAKRGPIKGLEVTAGKFKNPFEQGSSDLVWDTDVRPEGIYEKLDVNIIDTDDFQLKSYITGGQFVLNESSSLGKDAQLYAVQIGLEPVFRLPGLDSPIDWQNAVSYYDYNNFARRSNFMIGPTSLANGNPNVDLITTELDANKFRVFEYYSAISLYPTPWNVPLTLDMDFAGNPASGPTNKYGPTIVGDNFAWAIGGKVGNAKKKHDWELGYHYKYIGANSVVGAFNDSDFGFAGVRGSVFKFGYGITDSIFFNAAAFFTENLNPDSAKIIDQQRRLFQVDLVWKF